MVYSVYHRNVLAVNLIFPGDKGPYSTQNSTVITRFTGNHCERGWFVYSVSITLCNQELFLEIR